MSAAGTIATLLHAGADGALPMPAARWRRAAARAAWVKQAVAACREAQRRMDRHCAAAHRRLFDRDGEPRHPGAEEEFERLCDAEEARVQALRAPLDAVIERDEWPREL